MDKRVLSKVDEMDGYLVELDEIKPAGFTDYKNSIEKKRACERLLQLIIESVIDICNIVVSSMRLGLPAGEEEVFTILKDKKLISKKMADILSDMKGFRNILVHKYGTVDDELVFEMLSENLTDFEDFRVEILKNI